MTTLANTGGTAASALPAAGGSSSSTLSEWAGPYVTNMLGQAQALSQQPYQVYGGPMTAGESGLQSKVFQGLGNLTFPGQLGQSFSSTGAYQLPTMTSTGVTGQQAGPGGIAANYMNPYLSAVLTPQLDELRRQSQITQMGTAGKLAQAGAFGGSRQAIMDAETQRNLLQEQNKAIGTGYANAYDKAMQQFNTEQGQAKTLADMMGAAGAQQRGIEQEGITADYNEFLAQRDYPQKQVQFLQSMLQGLPISTVTNTPAQQSGLGQLSSTVGGIGSLLEAIKGLGLGK
jgi:hypothetical protein